MKYRAPAYVVPVTGWRTWRVDASGPEARLRSVVHATTWPVGEPMVAQCRGLPFSHPAPWPGCRCGVYAARDPCEAAFHAELPSRAREPLAIGLVALWGRLIESEAGWRASAAYPEALYLPLRRPGDREPGELIAWGLSAYGAPIELLECADVGVAEALRAATPRAPPPVAAGVMLLRSSAGARAVRVDGPGAGGYCRPARRRWPAR